MKEMYKSPVITVEELQKADVLCVSSPLDEVDNVTRAFSLVKESGDLTDLL